MAGQRLGGDGVEAWFGQGELAPLAQAAALVTTALALQEGGCTVELQCFDNREQKWQQGSSTGLGGWVHFCGAEWGTLLRAAGWGVPGTAWTGSVGGGCIQLIPTNTLTPQHHLLTAEHCLNTHQQLQ